MKHKAFKIKSNIPIPEASLKFPFKDMEIGDSFEVPKKYRSNVGNAAYYYGIRHNKKFMIKTGKDTARIWRIK